MGWEAIPRHIDFFGKNDSSIRYAEGILKIAGVDNNAVTVKIGVEGVRGRLPKDAKMLAPPIATAP